MDEQRVPYIVFEGEQAAGAVTATAMVAAQHS